MENAEQEFVSVVREYERVIYKVCYLYTTPNATLNDLYQEVVLNLWKAFPKFRPRKSLGRLVVIQRFSIGMGAVGLAALLLIWLLLPTFGFNEQLQGKIVALLGFIAISILIGMWWDWKTYRWNKDTRIDEMGVAEVSRRMTTFRQWTRYEVMGISIWIILFNILNYWVMEYHLAPASVQALLITLFVVFDALIIYILYKKVIYKHLDNIKKNIEELKDICTE